MRIFGHPLHPLLVHFPIAFWVLATLCDGCTVLGYEQARPFAGIFLALGLICALPAMLAGFIDLAKLEDAATRDGNRHMILMGLAWTVYLFALLARLDDKVLMPVPPVHSVALSLLGLSLVVLGGWYGGQLVYHHGAGVKVIEERYRKPGQTLDDA